MKSNILRHILLSNSSQALQFGSRWVLTIFLLKFLSIENFALFSFVYSLSNILLSVFPFGSSTYLILNKYTNLRDKQYAISSAFNIIFLLFIISCLAFLVLSPVLGHIKSWNYLPYGIVLSLILSLNLVFFSFYKGLGDFITELRAYIVFALGIFTILCLMSFYKVDDIRFVFIMLISLNVIVFLITLYKSLARKVITLRSLFIKPTHLRHLFKERKYFGLQEMTIAAHTQLAMLLLYYIVDEKTYGYYRALFVIIAPAFMITVAVSQVVLNKLKELVGSSRYQFFRKTQLYLLLLGLLISSLLLVFKSFLFNYFELPNNEFVELSYYGVIVILLMRYVFSNYEMLLVVGGKQNIRFWIMFFSAIVSTVLIFILPKHFGLIGAVSVNITSYAIVLIGCLYTSEMFEIKKIKFS